MLATYRRLVSQITGLTRVRRTVVHYNCRGRFPRGRSARWVRLPRVQGRRNLGWVRLPGGLLVLCARELAHWPANHGSLPTSANDSGSVRYANGQVAALLTDRIASARGQPQVFGTQADMIGGRVVLKPILDSANVDARRASMGLPSLKKYLRILDSDYAVH